MRTFSTKVYAGLMSRIGMPYIAFCDDNHFHVKHNRNDADDVIATIGIADSSDNIFISKSRSPSVRFYSLNLPEALTQ